MSTWIPSKGGPKASQRRSQRVMLSLSIAVRVEDGDGNKLFDEQTKTLVVNAHGALIALAGKVEKGQKIRLTNRATGTDQLCQVTYLGPVSGDQAQIGIEFLKPSPDFWHISFPPEDWTATEQAPATLKEKQQ